MKLEDIPKKQPFPIPDEAHFDSISSKIYAQIEKEEKNQNLSEFKMLDRETKSISINSQKTEKNKNRKTSNFWLRPQFIGIAATCLLFFVVLVGIYNYQQTTNASQSVAIKTSQKIDFSKISTQQINEFLIDENVSESELVSFIPQNSTLETTTIFEQSDLNSIDAESLDLMLEEEYF